MLERVRVDKIWEGWDDRTTYRVCEADGTPSVNWLPGFELDDPLGPLDRGGFDRQDDATAFACGVNFERAFTRGAAVSMSQLSSDNIPTVTRHQRRHS